MARKIHHPNRVDVRAGEIPGRNSNAVSIAWLEPCERARWLARMDAAQCRIYLESWIHWCHGGQVEPEPPWNIWLMMGGRGAGKTRTGAEWIKSRIAQGRIDRIALVGPTFSDTREVMIDGPSGLMSLDWNGYAPRYEVSRKRLVWPGGEVAQVFSAEDPDGLRGPQFDIGWGDEFAAWPKPQATLDILRMGVRLGESPQILLTTTPRPIPVLKRLVKAPDVAVSHQSTQMNTHNLADGFTQMLDTAYGQTHLARQELLGELIDDPPDALWQRSDMERARAGDFPAAYDRIVVAVDPPASSGERAAECGLIVAGAWGEGVHRRAVVLEDGSFGPARPDQWAQRCAALFEAWQADRVIAEANQGGDMVASVLRTASPDLPVQLVHAARGKRARAEPVAALYASDRIRHARAFPALEDQMCAFGAPDMPRGSPDRVDALVWALHALMLSSLGDPRLRQL